MEEILPFIIRQEPNLTDHGTRHIENVIDNCSRILGLESNRNSDISQLPLSTLKSTELLLILSGCLLHDIGNIVGRKTHNIVGARVWRDTGTSYALWDANDRRTVLAVCRAHTGTTEDGSFDTLKPLTEDRLFFANEYVRASEIAAIIRFADELAEGRQRTSAFLVKNGLIAKDSEAYHQYATCTKVQIDFLQRRVALTYDIDIGNNYFAGRKTQKELKLKAFLALIYGRVAKLEHERVFARHYAPNFVNFSETSVSMFFNNDGVPLTFRLAPLVLNDFNLRGDHPGLEKVNPSYRVSDVVRQVVEEGATHGE